MELKAAARSPQQPTAAPAAVPAVAAENGTTKNDDNEITVGTRKTTALNDRDKIRSALNSERSSWPII